MSVSSKSRKESTESYAAQQMHNTMGIAPELAQLNDKNLDNDLPSRVANSNDTDVPGDFAMAEALASEEGQQPTTADLEEARRASWGQPPLPADADDAATESDNPMTAYQQPGHESASNGNASNRTGDTDRGAMTATQPNEPDRTLGNS